MSIKQVLWFGMCAFLAIAPAHSESQIRYSPVFVCLEKNGHPLKIREYDKDTKLYFLRMMRWRSVSSERCSRFTPIVRITNYYIATGDERTILGSPAAPVEYILTTADGVERSFTADGWFHEAPKYFEFEL